MNKKSLLNLLIVIVSSLYFSVGAFANVGDTISFNGNSYKVLSANLISNPGFENGFVDWTDATTTAATLTSDKFSVELSGGVGNSNYLVGLNNEGSSSSGSIGTGWSIESGKSYLFAYQVKYLDNAALADTAEWLKTSLTNNKTSNEEPKILLDGAPINGGGVWTQNYIFFTNADPAYNYIVARFRWLSNLYGFDDFMLYEAIEVVDYEELEAAILEAQTIYDAGKNGAAALNDAITTAQGFLSSTSVSEVKQATSDLEKAINEYNYANASEANPVDLTHFIVNPSFELSYKGWENSGMSTQINDFFPGKDGSTYIEKWVSRGSSIPDVSIKQQLSGLPNGNYVLTAKAGNIQQTGSGSTTNVGAAQTGVFLFANDDKTAVDTIKERTVEFFVTNGTVTIGLEAINATGNWLTCDDFSLQYNGFDIDKAKVYIQELIDSANVLLVDKMNDAVRTELTSAISSAEIIIADPAATEVDLVSTIEQLISSINDAKVSVASYKDLQNVINTAVELYGDGTGNEAAAFKTVIDAATSISNNFLVSLEDVNNATDELSIAIFKYNIANPTGTVPVVITNPNYARGATMAFGRSTISGVDVLSLKEHGFCWSTNPEPTVLDSRTTKYFTNEGNIYHIENLKPSTVYYMRAYAITSGNAVGYGDVIKFITIPKGSVSYSLRSDITGDMLVRMEAATSSAVGYYNDLTSIKGHHLSVGYGSGTPTAEASYGGWMTFGPNTSYQRTGTVLHEMGHTIGVGTHSMWYGPSSPLRETGSRGTWLGERVDKVVQFINNDTTAHLTGDHIHMWPYGINGANEDDGSEFLYITNVLITQALGEDGLPPTGGFATPAYTFELKDNMKYYIKSEEKQTGQDSAFITIDQSGNLANKVMTPSEVLNNDSAAWQLAFDPVNSYYTIKNVATGRYFTFEKAGDNGISTIDRQNPASSDYFQLMRGRIETTIEAGSKSITSSGYWIIHPEAKSSPDCLMATTSDLTTTAGFDIANSSSSQRWLLLDSNEVEMIKSSPTTINFAKANTSSNIWVYSENKELHIENINSEVDVAVYNTSGLLVLKANNILSSYSHSMPEGIYIVVLNSDVSIDVKKVVVK